MLMWLWHSFQSTLLIVRSWPFRVLCNPAKLKFQTEIMILSISIWKFIICTVYGFLVAFGQSLKCIPVYALKKLKINLDIVNSPLNMLLSHSFVTTLLLAIYTLWIDLLCACKTNQTLLIADQVFDLLAPLICGLLMGI